MRRITVFIAAIGLLVGVVAACADLESDDPTETVDVGAEEPGPAGGEEEVSAEEIEARRERIRAYFDERLARLDIVATTETESGQVIDWIRPESQTTDGSVATPPLEPPALEPDPDAGEMPESEPPFEIAEPAFTDLQLEPGAVGPEGTVPVVRFDVETYLEFVEIPPEDPLDVITKIPPPAPESNDRYYTAWQRTGQKAYGTTAWINIWDTDGPVGNETSIAQTAVIRGTPMQAIEAGKIENKALDSALRPRFFTYFRTAGAASGDWKGGYNQTVDGWIQVSQNVVPGIGLGPVSTEDGTQYNLDLAVRIHEGDWWVGAFGQWAGYYPYCKGGDAKPCDDTTLFSESGLRDEADRLDWFGEIYDESAPKATSTDMGSGDFAADGWAHAAWFRNLTYYWKPATYWWWGSGSAWATDSDCYTVSGPFSSSNADWRNWFYFGGPGKEAANCT